MKFALAAALVAAALAFGPAAGYAAEKAPVQKPSEGFSDSSIVAKIKKDIDGDKELKPLNLRVDAVKGVVKLSGQANTKGQADKAGAIARSTSGVSRVQNEIRIVGK